MSNGCVLEVCVDSLESALEAQRGGAHRIELCSSLIEGGVTPSHGLLQATCRALTTCKVYALIRPRPGDFLYSDVCECQVIQQDLVHAVSVGAQGIVLGMLTADARIDCDRVRGVVDMCRALGELDLPLQPASVVSGTARHCSTFRSCSIGNRNPAPSHPACSLSHGHPFSLPCLDCFQG